MNESAEIQQMNPWWDNSDTIDTDEYVQSWLPMSYMPDVFESIYREVDAGVYVLRGMRQVGKTTLMKITIRNLLRSGINPLCILYYRSTDPEDIRNAIHYHRNILNSSAATGHRYLFLDGVASIPKWSKSMMDVLKSARDASVVISGYIGEMNGTDVDGCVPDFRRIQTPSNNNPTVPEMFGVQNGGDVTLKSMSFLEAAVWISPQIGEFIEGNGIFSPQCRREIFDNLIQHKIDSRLEEIYNHKKELNRVLDVYMATGGMPHAIDGYAHRGLSWDPQYQTYLDSITEAWTVLGRNPSMCVKFGRWLAGHENNLVSWDKIARGTCIMPPQAVLNCANLLERLFMLNILYRYKDGQPDTKAAKKIFFTDPVHLHMFRHSADPMAMPSPLYVPENRKKVLEGVVASHLLRLVRQMRPTRTPKPHSSVFYWTDKKSRMVDFVVDLGSNEIVPIMIMDGTVRRRDMSALTRFLTHTECRGLLLGRNDMEYNRDYLTVPVSVFLMLV